MLIAFMINAKLQEHRIVHNKRPTFCCLTKKEQSVKSYLMEQRWHASCLWKVHMY